jgi:hypothetical protein
LRQAVTGCRQRDKTFLAAALYAQRQNLSPIFYGFVRHLEEIDRSWHNEPGSLQIKALDNEIRLVLERYLHDIEESIKNSPPEAFVPLGR